MAINLGNVVGLLISDTAPDKLYVIWAKPLGTSPTETYDLYYHNGTVWERFIDSSSAAPESITNAAYQAGSLDPGKLYYISDADVYIRPVEASPYAPGLGGVLAVTVENKPCLWDSELNTYELLGTGGGSGATPNIQAVLTEGNLANTDLAFKHAKKVVWLNSDENDQAEVGFDEGDLGDEPILMFKYLSNLNFYGPSMQLSLELNTRGGEFYGSDIGLPDNGFSRSGAKYDNDIDIPYAYMYAEDAVNNTLFQIRPDGMYVNGTLFTGSSGVTSIDASIDGDALLVTGGPVTSTGVLAFEFQGAHSQYVDGLGYLTTFPTSLDSFSNDSNYQTLTQVNSLISAATVGLLDDRGDYDASTNLFPATGGSGSSGAILKGDMWRVSVAGTLGGADATVGDWFRALSDTPGQTAANWSVAESNFGYVAANAATTLTLNGVTQSLATNRTWTVGDALTTSGLSQFAPTSSFEFFTVLSNKTGSNLVVFNDTPTLVTPILGVATVTTINKVTITAPATSAALTIANLKTFTISNTLTFTGTDASSVAFGGGGTVVYVGLANTWTAGIKQRFSPSATTSGFNFGSVAGDVSAPANGDAWYDSTNNLLRARINGANVSLGAGGGGGDMLLGTAQNVTAGKTFAGKAAFTGVPTGIAVSSNLGTVVSFVRGDGGTSGSVNTRTAIEWGDTGGVAGPSAINALSAGDKIVLNISSSLKQAIGIESGFMWFQNTDSSTAPGYKWYLGTTTPGSAFMQLNSAGTLSVVTMQLNISAAAAAALVISTSGAANTQWFDFGAGAQAPPAFTIARSLGSKLVLYKLFNSGSTSDMAIGCESGAMWFGLFNASSSQFFKWYGAATEVMRLSGTGILTLTGDLKLGTAGNGIYIKEGTNCTMGVATMVAGVVTVSTTKVTATSRISLTIQSLGTVTLPQAIAVTARTAVISFTITSAMATDTSVVMWQIIEPL